MKRNRFNQAKHQWTSTNNLTLSKAHKLFLEDNDNIEMKNTYEITNVHPPMDEEDVINEKFCDNKLLSSSNKIYYLIKNITDLRKGEFDKVTTKTLQLKRTQVIDELINEFIKTAIEVTNTVNFCNRVVSGTIFKYNQSKLELDNNKLNQNLANIQLDDIFY